MKADVYTLLVVHARKEEVEDSWGWRHYIFGLSQSVQVYVHI